ncbi:MAG: VWA domain-containing protein [Candidatus Abyssobacteria bacterium SURF_5]|uniref:VWA domain-containing protein n=1 Tax=Abyssobacteria bacterium (strain SURF_5) TaxID=2093360 RepID=A0A3A4N9R3_ABYX5|nr:MAG: VWA domain-containing protein [Candidatus Abyssubacteria bacterium SURF_5]
MQKLNFVRASAVRAVLARARAAIGSSKKETKRAFASSQEKPYCELDLDKTVEQVLGKPFPEPSDLCVEYKEQKRFDCALILDTSLSMSGTKLALLAVAAAVVALKLPSEDFSVVSFESSARIIKTIRKSLAVEKLIIKLLEVPAAGYTNIRAGLDEGLKQLKLGRRPDRLGVLLSDGKYTLGEDPLIAAARFPRLHVVALGDFNVDPEFCASMASAGKGRLYEAPSFEGLPRVLHRLLVDLLT